MTLRTGATQHNLLADSVLFIEALEVRRQELLADWLVKLLPVISFPNAAPEMVTNFEATMLPENPGVFTDPTGLDPAGLSLEQENEGELNNKALIDNNWKQVGNTGIWAGGYVEPKPSPWADVVVTDQPKPYIETGTPQSNSLGGTTVYNHGTFGLNNSPGNFDFIVANNVVENKDTQKFSVFGLADVLMSSQSKLGSVEASIGLRNGETAGFTLASRAATVGGGVGLSVLGWGLMAKVDFNFGAAGAAARLGTTSSVEADVGIGMTLTLKVLQPGGKTP